MASISEMWNTAKNSGKSEGKLQRLYNEKVRNPIQGAMDKTAGVIANTPPVKAAAGYTRFMVNAGKGALDIARVARNSAGYLGSSIAGMADPNGPDGAAARERAGQYADSTYNIMNPKPATMGLRADSPYSYVPTPQTNLAKANMLPQSNDWNPNDRDRIGILDKQNEQNRAALLDPARQSQFADAAKGNLTSIGGNRGGDRAGSPAVAGVGAGAGGGSGGGGAAPQDAGKRTASGGLNFTVDGKSYYSPSGNRMDAIPVPQSGAPQTAQAPQATQTRSGSSTDVPADNSYKGLVGELANRGRGNNKEVEAAIKALQDSRLAEIKDLQNLSRNEQGRSLSSLQGLSGLKQNAYLQEQNALASTLASQVGLQGQQIGATQGAMGAMSPMQYGLTMDPHGNILNMASMQAPLQTAMQLYQAKTPFNDPRYVQALAPLGSAGMMVFLNYLQNGGAGGQGGFNPAAQSAAAEQELGFATDLLGQNQYLGQGLALLNALQPKVTAFMREAGINPTDNRMMNEQIGVYLDNIQNPGAFQAWNAIKLELGGVVQQILAAKQSAGMAPDATELLAVSDPGALSMTQLNYLMNTWKALGGTRLGVNQNLYQQTGGYGNVYQGGNPNQGSFDAAPPGSGPLAGVTDPAGQTAAGILTSFAQAPGAALNWIGSIFR